jgi:hypothetical protein
MGILVPCPLADSHPEFEPKKRKAFFSSIHHSRFGLVQYETKPFEHLAYDRHGPFGTLPAQHDEVSQRRELPPSLLSEPDVNLSAHPAPILQPTAKSPSASARTISVIVGQADPASVLHSCGGD